MPWADASWARIAAALDKLELATWDVLRDFQDECRDKPALKSAFPRGGTIEEQVRFALEYFGDLGHPQPTERTEWSEGPALPGVPKRRTRDWPGGRLPPLESRGR